LQERRDLVSNKRNIPNIFFMKKFIIFWWDKFVNGLIPPYFLFNFKVK